MLPYPSEFQAACIGCRRPCESTARDACYRDHRVFFLADGTGTVNEEMHLASLLNLAYGFARITTCAEIAARLAGTA